MKKSLASLSRRAFSLIELIVVISIIVVIAGFTVPQAGQILKGSTLTQGSTILVDQIRLAREYALTKNCKVEVRFYQYADPEMPGEVVTNSGTWNYRAMQLFQVLNVTEGALSKSSLPEVMLPLDKVQTLPQGVVMNSTTTFSSLLNNSNSVPIPGVNEASQLQLPRGVGSNYNYVTFRFLQDGSTNLAPTGTTGWFITIHSLTDKGYLQSGIPFNFFTLQVDPVIGSTRAYRPQAG